MKSPTIAMGLAAVFSLLPASVSADSLAEGLVAFYPFTGNADDTSGNNRHLTVTDANLVSDRYGRAKAAYVFNGTSSLMEAAGTQASTNLAAGFSISCWVKIASFNPNGTTLVRKDGEVGLNIFNYQSPNRIAIEAFKDGQQHRGFTGTPPVGEWCMVTATWDGTTFGIFLNGAAQEVEQDSLSRTLQVYPISVGGSVPFPTQTLNGVIDDVRIYSRALSSAEVSALFALNDGPVNVFTGAWYEAKAAPGLKPSAGEIQVMLFGDNRCMAVREFNDQQFDLGEGTWTAGKRGRVTVRFVSDFAGETFTGAVKNGLLIGSFKGGGYTGKFFTGPVPEEP
jgi:hypothetical protein